MSGGSPTRIVVLGGGFAGMYAVMQLERLLGRRDDVEITLVNKDNFFVFTPMLHEVAASDLDLTHIVNPIRKLLRRARSASVGWTPRRISWPASTRSSR